MKNIYHLNLELERQQRSVLYYLESFLRSQKKKISNEISKFTRVCALKKPTTKYSGNLVKNHARNQALCDEVFTHLKSAYHPS